MGTGIDPIIFIGKAGWGDTLINQLEEALEVRELVKIRVIPNAPVNPKEIAPKLAAEAKAELVQIIGRNILIYRRSLKKPSIELPR